MTQQGKSNAWILWLVLAIVVVPIVAVVVLVVAGGVVGFVTFQRAQDQAVEVRREAERQHEELIEQERLRMEEAHRAADAAEEARRAAEQRAREAVEAEAVGQEAAPGGRRGRSGRPDPLEGL